MRITIVVNEPPYGSERCYNALQLALTLSKKSPNIEVLVFLQGDAVACAKDDQVTSKGGYNIEQMLREIITNGGSVLASDACMDARGLTGDELLYGVWQGSTDELAEAVINADKNLVF